MISNLSLNSHVYWDTLYIPRVKSIKTGLLPPHNISLKYGINRNTFRIQLSNRIWLKFINRTLTHDMFAKESKTAKTSLDRLKREDKHKGCQMGANQKSLFCLEPTYFSQPNLFYFVRH